MALDERDAPPVAGGELPGKRESMKAWFALTVSVVLTLLTLGLFALGQMPAIVLLVLALPLGAWSVYKIRHNERAAPQGGR